MTVKFEMDGPLAIATISDPPMNLLTAESLTDLEAAMEKALEAKARAFLTLAEGDHFCRGVNVPENFPGQERERWPPLAKPGCVLHPAL